MYMSAIVMWVGSPHVKVMYGFCSEKCTESRADHYKVAAAAYMG